MAEILRVNPAGTDAFDDEAREMIEAVLAGPPPTAGHA
jgi:hypothetical protein